ncbi:MAG TPA: hypothetical protein VLH61_05840 [Bacteroidales bacterium]|nr:hypothetical protein [Bacteroidales bacterium]
MKTFVPGFALFLLLSGMVQYAQAFQDYPSLMRKDIVTIKDGRFTAQEFMLLSYYDGSTVQVKISASSPVEIMSRDFFVSFFSSNAIILLLAMLEEAGGELPDIREIDELIGDPDITINFVMTRIGVQTQVITFDSRENFTMSWEEFFYY